MATNFFKLLAGVVATGAMVIPAFAAPYTLFAAETNPFSLGGDTANYGGLQTYDFANPGGSYAAGSGVAASQLHDAAGVVVRGHKVYVSNRHGNTLGMGSIQEFTWNGSSLSGGATIASAALSGHQGWHGFSFAPNGDLFVTTVNSGTRRFRDSGSGFVDIGGTGSGAVRDAWISPDGNKLIESGINGSIFVSDVLANSIGPATGFGIAGGSIMHQMTYAWNSLYVTSYNTHTVHRVMFDANFNPISSSVVTSASNALGIAFSPDGNEMLVSQHGAQAISRFSGAGSSWTANGTISTGHSMGYLAAVPEPASMTMLGIGALALLKRRKK